MCVWLSTDVQMEVSWMRNVNKCFTYPLIYEKPHPTLHLSSLTFSFHPMPPSLETLNALKEINSTEEFSGWSCQKFWSCDLTPVWSHKASGGKNQAGKAQRDGLEWVFWIFILNIGICRVCYSRTTSRSVSSWKVLSVHQWSYLNIIERRNRQ